MALVDQYPTKSRNSSTGNEWNKNTTHLLSRVEYEVLLSREMSAQTPEDYAKAVIEISEGSDERQRRELTARRRAILNDAWQGLLHTDLKGRLTKELHKWVCGARGQFCDTSRNAAKSIWTELAVLYRTAVLRQTEDPTNIEKYRKLLRGSKFNLFMSSAELELGTFNDLLLWPTVTEVHGKKVIRHHKAAGDSVTVAFDAELGHSEPYVVLLRDTFSGPDGQDDVRYAFWTPQWRMMFNSNGDRIDHETGLPVEDGAPNDNPYGRLPFVFGHLDPFHPRFWNQTTGDDLVELTIKQGRQQSMTNDLFNRSGHKQLVTTGERINDRSDKSLLDPGSHIKITGNSLSTQTMDWQLDFTARQELLDNDEGRAAASRGISPERLRKTSYTSAESARLAERGLSERRERMEGIFSDIEQEYYELVCLVASDAGMKEVPDPEAELEVAYAPIDYPGDPMARLELAERKARLGLSSMVELILEDHPTWNIERAVEFLGDNIERLAEIAEIKASRKIPNNMAVMDAADERNGLLGPAVRDGDSPPGSKPGNQSVLGDDK